MIITSISQQIRQPNRYSISVDGKYAFSLSDIALLDSKIVVGQELTPADVKKFKQLSADDKAYAAVVRYVAIRPRSEWEITTYLTRKKVDPVLAGQLIAKLTHLDLVNDQAFARAWVENRRLLKPISRRRLTQELQQKRISPDIIETVLQDDKETVDEQSQLREIVLRKQGRYPDRQKFMQYLARQGFGYEDIKAVLEENTDA